MSRVSFQTGWWPPGRSMMLSRRMPSAKPGARDSPVRNPASSGPRCSSAAAMARTRASASALREANATPHMPHTLLFDLRRGKEGSARAKNVFAEAEARDPEAIVRVPSKNQAQKQKYQCGPGGSHEDEKRLALEKQAPVEHLIPPGIDAVQHFAHCQAVER